jgi:outer membrane protein assembly factor BamB
MFGQTTACGRARVRLDGATGAVLADDPGFGSTAVPAGSLIAQNITPDNDCQRDIPSVVARDSSSLATIWSAPAGFPTSSDLIGPTVAGGQLYSTGAFGISAFAASGCGAATCSPLWTFAPPQFQGTVGPVAAPGGGEVYAVLYHPFTGSTPADLVALSAATGQVNWQAPLGTSAIAGNLVKLASDGTSVYAAMTSPAGRIVAAYLVGGCGAPTCSPTWTGSTTQPEISEGSRPVVAAGVVYLPDAAGVHAFAAKGCGAATCPEIASVPVSGGAAFVTVDGGRLYAVGRDHLTALAPT